MRQRLCVSEAAKKLFADCQTQEAIQAGQSENRDAVLEEFRKNLNIRVVVSCTRIVSVGYFPLPMNGPQLSAVFNRLDELREGMYDENGCLEVDEELKRFSLKICKDFSC